MSEPGRGGSPVTGSLLEAALFAAIGFLVACGVEVLLIVALSALFHSSLAPRGLGWIVVPFATATAGWGLGRAVGVRAIAARFGVAVAVASTGVRLWMVGFAIWLVLIVGIFLIFDPFDQYRWRSEEWTKFFAILLGPPLLSVFGWIGFTWASRSASDK